MFLNCGDEEDSWEFFGKQGDQPINPKGNQPWIFIGRTAAEAEAPILWPPDGKSWLTWKRPWCWERLKVGGEGDNRELNGWMASPTQWTWVWVNSGSRWWTGRPGVLQSMGSQSRTRMSDWTELNFPFRSHRAWSTVPYSRFPPAILYTVSIVSIYTVYMCQPQSPVHPSQPPLPLWCPYSCSLHLCLYFCFASKIIYTIFLDSTYMR